MLISEAFFQYERWVLYKKASKTRRNYRTTLASIVNAIGDVHIELISPEHMDIWQMQMLADGKTGTTQRGYIVSLRMVLNYFRVKKGMNIIDLIDLELPDNDTKPREHIEPEHVDALINAATNARDRAIIACTFITGARISEILSLDRYDFDVPIDEDGYQEVSIQGKNGKWRPIFFNEKARRYLDDYLATRTDRYRPIFISRQNRRISVSTVEKMLHQCARVAGVEKHVTPHILRHSFATDLLNNQAPLYEVSKLLGHANIATTANIYGHFDTKNRKNALLRSQSQLA